MITFEKGSGKTKVITPNEKYICKLYMNARPFFRLASKLKGAASALKDHIEQKHRSILKPKIILRNLENQLGYKNT